MSKQNMQYIKKFIDAIDEVVNNEEKIEIEKVISPITEKTNSKMIIKKYLNAFHRLENDVSNSQFDRIMQIKGKKCEACDKKGFSEMNKIFNESNSIEKFMDKLISSSNKKHNYYFENKAFCLEYNPKELGINCYCPLLRNNKNENDLSRNCECSRSFVENRFNRLTKQKWKVEIIESTCRGNNKCKFKLVQIK